MDQVWQSAPGLAIKVWHDGARLAWTANPALLDRASLRGASAAQWQALAASLHALPLTADPVAGKVGFCGKQYRVTGCMLEPGRLYWLEPQRDEVPESQRDEQWLAAMFDLAQHAGRLVAFERNLRSGHGRWSPSGFRLFQFDPSQGVPPVEAVLDRVHPQEREAAVQSWHQNTSTPGRREHRTRVLLPDGCERHLHVITDVRSGTNGKPEILRGVMIDDTEAVALRGEQVRLSAQRFDLVIRSLGVGVWSIDPATKETQWNEQMFLIHAVPLAPRPPHMSYIVRNLIHPDDRGLVTDQRERMLRAEIGDIVHTEFRIIRPDGAVRWVSNFWRYESTPEGRPMIYGALVDITDRHDAEEAVRAMEQRCMLAAEAAGIGMWERNAMTGETTWNAQMYRLRGYEPDCGLTPEELRRVSHHPEDAPAVEQLFAQAFRNGTGYESRFRVIWPDGSLHWLVTRGVAQRDPAGRFERLVGINWDITESKRAEQALREKAATEQASQAKSEFLSRMSHELRTPLNALLGFTQMLAHDREEQLSERHAEWVRHIHASGVQITSLIDDVLDLASIEEHRVRLELQPVLVQAAIDDVLRWMQEAAEAAEVVLHAEPTRAWVMADARRLRQVLASLVNNAIKFNRPQGQVHVAVQPYPVRGGEGWQLRVRDTGCGISPQQQAHLFEPFDRIGAQPQGVARPSIGLATVRQLVEMMGGHIEVRSEPGKGSEFRVGLPSAPTPQRAVGQTPVPPQTNGATARSLAVLYIEDNAVNALLVEQLMALRPNMRLLSAADGASGVALARAGRPDLVLVDVQLPDFDGYEVLRRLKADPHTASTRYIALSARAMPEEIERARRAGFDDYWTKPIDLDRFLAALDTIADARASSSPP